MTRVFVGALSAIACAHVFTVAGVASGILTALAFAIACVIADACVAAIAHARALSKIVKGP